MESVDDLSVYGSALAQLLEQMLEFNVHFTHTRDVFIDANTGWEDLGAATFADPQLTRCGRYLVIAVMVLTLAMAVAPILLRVVVILAMGYGVGLTKYHRVMASVSDSNLRFILASYLCFIHGGLASIAAPYPLMFWPLFVGNIMVVTRTGWWWWFSQCHLDQQLLMVVNVMVAVIYPLRSYVAISDSRDLADLGKS